MKTIENHFDRHSGGEKIERKLFLGNFSIAVNASVMHMFFVWEGQNWMCVFDKCCLIIVCYANSILF